MSEKQEVDQLGRSLVALLSVPVARDLEKALIADAKADIEPSPDGNNTSIQHMMDVLFWIYTPAELERLAEAITTGVAYNRRGKRLPNPEGDDPYYWCHNCGKHAIYGPKRCWECSPGEWERAEEDPCE